jgi:hypothetical protein
MMDPLAGRIELCLPPDSRYMRLARLMASGVATIDEERLALSRQILDVVTDGHDLSQSNGVVSFTARKLVRGRGVG